MTFLEDWASLDENHLISVVGAIEALKASTLRLPVGGGATVCNLVMHLLCTKLLHCSLASRMMK